MSIEIAIVTLLIQHVGFLPSFHRQSNQCTEQRDLGKFSVQQYSMQSQKCQQRDMLKERAGRREGEGMRRATPAETASTADGQMCVYQGAME